MIFYKYIFIHVDACIHVSTYMYTKCGYVKGFFPEGASVVHTYIYIYTRGDQKVRSELLISKALII